MLSVFDWTGLWLRRLAMALAIGSGVILTGIALLTVVSIIGRALIPIGLGPIPGDYELVEMGAAVAVFGFLPWCQLNRGNVTVDIFVDRMPRVVRNFLTLIGDLALLTVSAVILWRLWLGLGEKIQYQETTFILDVPVWYGFALGTIGAALFPVICAYSVWGSLLALIGMRPADQAAGEHL